MAITPGKALLPSLRLMDYKVSGFYVQTSGPDFRRGMDNFTHPAWCRKSRGKGVSIAMDEY